MDYRKLKYKDGTLFYKRGTKQRFIVLDRNFSGEYILKGLEDIRRKYCGFLTIDEKTLEKQYSLII